MRCCPLSSAARLCVLAALAAFFPTPEPLRGADHEVGDGKAFASIGEALAAAAAGDRVVVFSGTYDEQITWTKPVDIVEAPGESAVLRPTDALGGPFLVDIILGESMEVLWEGIDLVYASTKFSRLFMNRVGAPSATVTIQGISVTDDNALSGGVKGRVFTAETGTMELIDVLFVGCTPERCRAGRAG
jgi:hypothetical protein